MNQRADSALLLDEATRGNFWRHAAEAVERFRPAAVRANEGVALG